MLIYKLRGSFLFLFILLVFVALQISAQTWSVLTRLTWNSGDSRMPSIAVSSSSSIHIAWWDYSPGNAEIFYRRSTDGGTSWSALTRMTWNTGTSREPAIAADSGSGVHLVWWDDTPGNWELYYKRSTNSGATWSGLARLTWNTDASYYPSIAADSSGGVYVVWTDNVSGDPNICFKRSTDGGAAWSGITRLSWTTGLSYNPQVAAGSGGSVHVVWYDNVTGNSEIYYKRSTDGGSTWSGLTRLTWNTGWSSNPSIAAGNSGKIHVVWWDESPGNYEIFYKNSSDSGSSWSGMTRLTWNAWMSDFPSIAVDPGGGIHVVWEDNPSSGKYDIFYRNSTNSGSTWSALTRLSWNSGESVLPRVAVDSGGGVHVTWEDDTPNNSEIFYKNRK